MLTCHELLGFMNPTLALEILEYAFGSDRPLYRTVLQAVAEARKVRPAFLERKPRHDRHLEMVATLSRPRMEEVAANLLRTWLVKSQTAMLVDFLNSLGIAHENGVVNEFPPSVEDAKLNAAIEQILTKYPPEKVAIYLNTISATTATGWKNLETLLQTEKRLQLG